MSNTDNDKVRAVDDGDDAKLNKNDEGFCNDKNKNINNSNNNNKNNSNNNCFEKNSAKKMKVVYASVIRDASLLQHGH